MKILCTGDVHVGRRSSRLPSGTETHPHSASAAWERVVDLAIAERVDLVAVTGDLVDEENRYFEAIGPVERGLRRLGGASIPTMLVSGNHDHDVLPRIVEACEAPGVRVLGRGGRWERVTLELSGSTIHVDGWSFPQARCTVSPLTSYPTVPPDGAPVIALVHGDLDQPRSPYGPITVAELRRHAGTLFLLGHVHAPRVLSENGGARAIYPGSPQALDPGETGVHGATIVELEPGGFSARSVPLSTVRYGSVDVDVGGLEHSEDIDAAVTLAIRENLERAAAEGGALRHLSLRVRLTGASRLHRLLDNRFAGRVTELDLESGSVRLSVESVDNATRPAVDLEALAASSGTAGLLAGLILQLDTGDADPATEQLLADAVRARRSIRHATPYLEILDPEGDEEGMANVHVRRELRRAATVLLDELLAQKEVSA